MLRHVSRQAVQVLLEEYERVRRELALELRNPKGTAARVRSIWDRIAAIDALTEWYRSSIDPLAGEVRLQGSPASPPMASLGEGHALLLAQELVEPIDANLTGVLRKTRDVYRETQARAAIAAMTKGESDLATRLVKDMRARGLTSGPKAVVKKDGTAVHWSLEAYARMLARTIPHKAAQEVHDRRAAESGIDLVIVVGGVGGTTCHTCREALRPKRRRTAEGRAEVAKARASLERLEPIYSRSGKDRRYPPLQPLLNAKPPLGHPNCGHQWVPYVEVTRATDEEIDAAITEAARKVGAMRLLREEV